MPYEPDPTAMAVTDREFAEFQELIYGVAGIFLAPAKKALLEARLGRRVRELGLPSFAAYYRRVVGDHNELVRLLDRIATNETHFFREPNQFEYLAQEVLPEWLADGDAGCRPRTIKAWSAGCSSGEEPYSIAMLLADSFSRASGWNVDILATDLSTRVLASAADGIWPIAKANEIPTPYLKRFMLRGTGSRQGTMKAGVELRELIRFQRVNLNDVDYPVDGPFDLILCRNVLIYFDQRSRSRVIERLVDRLVPGGLLFVGHAESLSNVTDRVAYVAPTIYRKPAGTRRPAYAGGVRQEPSPAGIRGNL